jgi:hypothetical protein
MLGFGIGLKLHVLAQLRDKKLLAPGRFDRSLYVTDSLTLLAGQV